MASSKNIGDQIFDAVQNAVNSQDYSNLQSTVERSLNTAADNIGRGIAQAQESLQRAQDSYTRERMMRSQKAQMDLIYGKPASQKALGFTEIIGGGVIGLPMLLAGALLIATEIPAFYIPMLLIGAAGVGAMAFGVRTLKFVKRFEKYRDVIQLRTFCYIDELASIVGRSKKDVIQDIKRIQQKGLFKQAMLDDTESFVIMNAAAGREYREAQASARRRQQQQTIAESVVPQKPASNGAISAEAQALLARGEAYITKLRLSNDAIPDEEVSRKIDAIERVVRQIFDHAKEHPEVIDDLGKLMDYYLPTTVKLLDAYRELDAQPIQGDNIKNSKREISATLDTLSTAFEKLLDQIFRDVAWDVSSDISVLHTVLAQEGLTANPFENADPLANANPFAAPQQPAQAAQPQQSAAQPQQPASAPKIELKL